MSRLTRTVALVGMMGAGKSSVGRRLASALQVPFRDADTEIETAAGCSINEIFARFGEDAFREGERKVIARMLGDAPHVLATGGGAFIDGETRTRLKADAFSVWISVPLEVLWDRVKRRDTRPLLKRDNPREVLETLLREREPVYAEADLKIDSLDGPHNIAVGRIIEALKDHGVLT